MFVLFFRTNPVIDGHHNMIAGLNMNIPRERSNHLKKIFSANQIETQKPNGVHGDLLKTFRKQLRFTQLAALEFTKCYYNKEILSQA